MRKLDHYNQTVASDSASILQIRLEVGPGLDPSGKSKGPGLAAVISGTTIFELQAGFAPSHPAKPQGWGAGGFRGGVKQFLRDFIADNASSMPWKRDLLGTFPSFCPIVTQNPTLVHSLPSLCC